METRGVNSNMKLLIGVLAAALIALGIVLWRQQVAVRKAENEVALNTTRMLREIFVAKGDLRVGQLGGVVVAGTVNDGMVFRTTQTTRAPVTVNYLLDLTKTRAGEFTFDAGKRVLTIRLPDVSMEAPAVDMARAEVRQNGIWISRGAGVALQKTAATRIAARATERAKNEANLAKARVAARDSVIRLVQRPLNAVGYGDVEIRALFPWEQGGSTDRMDRSRSLGEVYANQF